uniref:Putative hexapeptide repeat-containing transferase n=1 Tax=viral metagenome TaxID=1070528 RepID=A0A6H1ZPC6_9ZZZZ
MNCIECGKLNEKGYRQICEARCDVYIDPTAVIDKNVTIGRGTKIWHWTHIMGGASIGKYCTIGQGVFIGAKVAIGDQCKVQNGANIFEGVVIENKVFIGPSVTFTNVKRPYAIVSMKHKFELTFVRVGSVIGANSTIICGVEIGKNSMVGAGSVVTHDVKPSTLVVGNPARILSPMSE